MVNSLLAMEWLAFHLSTTLSAQHTNLVAWCSGNVFDPINEVTVCWARLVLRWVTACGQVNRLSM